MRKPARNGFVQPIPRVIPLLLLLAGLTVFRAREERAHTRAPDAALAVQKFGYTEATVVDRYGCFDSVRLCGGCNIVAFEVSAVNANGDRVDLIACCNPHRGG